MAFCWATWPQTSLNVRADNNRRLAIFDYGKANFGIWLCDHWIPQDTGWPRQSFIPRGAKAHSVWHPSNLLGLRRARRWISRTSRISQNARMYRGVIGKFWSYAVWRNGPKNCNLKPSLLRIIRTQHDLAVHAKFFYKFSGLCPHLAALFRKRLYSWRSRISSSLYRIKLGAIDDVGKWL